MIAHKVYNRPVKTYLIKTFERPHGSSERKALPHIGFVVGDAVDPIQYVKRDHAKLLQPPLYVELYGESGNLIWESFPSQD